MNNPCPCCSGKEYAACCEPMLLGAKLAESAEELLRSRYTAHVKRQIDYILQTVLPEQAHRHDRKAIEEWARSTEWTGLEVLEVKDGKPEDAGGIIEFNARFRIEGKEKKHHEIALFRKVDGKWYFDDGETKLKPIINETAACKPNDPCSCGSGRKFKKCCGR